MTLKEEENMKNRNQREWMLPEKCWKNINKSLI